jgi:hypothetical protein
MNIFKIVPRKQLVKLKYFHVNFNLFSKKVIKIFLKLENYKECN